MGNNATKELNDKVYLNNVSLKYRMELIDIIKKGKELNMKGIKRPNRFGHGKYMTVAIVEKKKWLGNNDETLNKEKVCETLKSYRKFLKITMPAALIAFTTGSVFLALPIIYEQMYKLTFVLTITAKPEQSK